MGMRIGEVAKATGLKIETIRFYEAEGVVSAPERSAGNYRLYNEARLQRLLFVKRARDLGFTLEQVRDLMRLSDNPHRPCEEVDVIATRHLADIERKLADLHALRGELAMRLEHCARTEIAHCRIIDALSAR